MPALNLIRGLSMQRGPLLTRHATSVKYLNRLMTSKASKSSGEYDATEPKPGSSPSTVKTRSPPKPVTVESMEDLLQELLDPEKFGSRGELWFFAQTLLIALIAFPPGGIRQIVDVLGGCFLVFGLAFIALGGLNLGQNLTPVPKPRDVHSLVTDGIYSVVRHPMYGGVILCGLGLSLSTGDEARLALTALTFYVLDQKATVEEEYLEEKYLEEYKEYKKSGVKKLIPWLY